MLYWVPHCSIALLKSPRPSLLIKRAALGNLKAAFIALIGIAFSHLKRLFSKTYPSFLTVKEGFFLPLRLSCKESSTFSPSPSSSGSGDVTALLGARNRCALRLADQSGLRHVLRDGTAWRWRASPIERDSVGKYCPN